MGVGPRSEPSGHKCFGQARLRDPVQDSVCALHKPASLRGARRESSFHYLLITWLSSGGLQEKASRNYAGEARGHW